MQQKIVTLPDDVLRKRAQEVAPNEFSSKQLLAIIHRMATALRSTDDGIGIAAPQIGVSKRIFLASEEALAIDTDDTKRLQENKNKKKTDWQYYTFINPRIIKKSSQKNSASEGCLSVPGVYGSVSRSSKIKVVAYDEHGKRFERGATKLFARLIQHEVDHLEGTLFIDSAGNLVTIEKQ